MKKVNVNISAVNLVNVCVDTGNGTCYGGRLYHRYDAAPKQFQNLAELLQLMEENLLSMAVSSQQVLPVWVIPD